MKEGCGGEHRRSVEVCAAHLLWSSVGSLRHGPLLILSSYNIYQSLCCLLCHTRCLDRWVFFLLLLLLPHAFSLSFCHSSKYPVGPGCGLLVLVYLVLGSIQLQAEASHSSRSHKMWLVLTTALQGDGLIGLIVADRPGLDTQQQQHAVDFCHFLLYHSLLSAFSPSSL